MKFCYLFFYIALLLDYIVHSPSIMIMIAAISWI